LACFGPLNRKIATSAAIATWFAALATSPDWPRLPLEGAIGNFHEAMRLAALFLTGACYFLYRERISYTAGLAAIAAIGLSIALFNRSTAGPAIGILGGYLIFWFAFLPNTPLLNEINSKIDLSYGIYLYAWPVQMLLIRYVEGITPGLIILFTVFIAGLLAYLSWTFVEQPFLSRKSLFLSASTLRRRSNVHTGSTALNQNEEEVVAASSDRPLDLSRHAQT
jgi:peptidoglycan/LPS O-acetylase OafA/YrhL